MSKKKGTRAERELLHLLWNANFATLRTAGSGSITIPSCDLLVGKRGKVFAIECKFIKDKIYDSYFSVISFKKRLWDKSAKPFNFEFRSEPTTQKLMDLYEENSGFYIFTKKSFIKNSNRVGVKPKMINLNKIESFDIDTIGDLDFIKYILLLNEFKK